MTELLCPDGCKDRKTGDLKKFMNMQNLRMHLRHVGGDDIHPDRTNSEIEGLIFNPALLPKNNDNTAAPAKKGISIKKRRE